MTFDPNEELGPLLVAPAEYLEVRSLIREALGFPNDRRPLLIGIDGLDGSGKSSLTSWLAWQLEMPALHLDIYMIRDSHPLSWRFDELASAIDGAQFIPRKRPVIVEGVWLLRVLDRINRAPDCLICVEKESHDGCMEDLPSYIQEARARATFILKWSSAEHDLRVMQAHLRHG
jgi:hypothetical protein